MIARVFFGEKTFEIVLACEFSVMGLVHLIVLLRTKNMGHLIVMLYYFFGSLTFFSSEQSDVRLVSAICTGILLILFMHILLTKKIKWRHTEIMELAARPITESNNGYTTRPFPAGKAKYSKDEIIGFAKFMIKHVIAFPYFEKNKVTLVVPQNMYKYFFSLKQSYKNDSYVSFDFSGKISVFITKRDYQKFKQELTFDRLCESLGSLFREFLSQYKKGESGKIIDRLNALNFSQ